MKKFSIIIFSSLAFLLMFTGCENLVEPSHVDGIESVAFDRSVSNINYFPGTDIVQMETGTLGPGAEYLIGFPPGWVDKSESDRKLVVFVHGYVPRDTGELSSVDNYMEMVEYFLSGDYAVLLSSFSENGWAVKDGTIRTRQLRSYFFNKYPPAGQTLLFGVSEGSLITVKLTEQNPELFNGAFAFAGPLGGGQAQFAHIIDVRLVFDYFFKDFIKYNALDENDFALSLAYSLGYDLTGLEGDKGVMEAVPDPLHKEYVDPTVFITAMSSLFAPQVPVQGSGIPSIDPLQLLAGVSVNGIPLFVYEPREIPISILTALWYNIYGTQDILERTKGDFPVDNQNSVYAFYTPAGNVPFDVERLVSSNRAEKYLEKWYQPKGILQIPLVTLHFTRDPAVPAFHDLYYKEKIQDPLSESMLTQLSVDAFGHTVIYDFIQGLPVENPAMTQYCINEAFELLVKQVELSQY